MAVNLGSAYAKVELDANGLIKGVDKAKASLGQMEKAAVSGGNKLLLLSDIGAKVGQAMQRVGAILTLTVTGPLLLLGKTVVQQAANVQDAMRRTDEIFGASADGIKKWAEGAALSIGMAKGAALDGANQFGLLFTQLNMSSEESAEMSKSLVQLVADVAKFNKEDPAAVVSAFQQALTGSTEGLAKYNIQISESDILTKAADLGLVEYTRDMGDVSKATRDAEEAQRRLAAAQGDGGVDADKVTSAQRRLVNANDAVSDATTRVQRAQQDLQRVMSNSKATDQQIQNARERLADAEERLADARRKATWAASDLTEAQRPIAPNADRIASAENNVADAEERLQKALKGKLSDLDDATKAQVIYALIIEKSMKQQGYFSKTTADFSTQLIIFKAVLQNAFEKLGNVMLPTLTKILIYLIKFLDWFVNAPEWVQKAVVALGLFLLVLGPLLGMLGWVVSLLSGLVGIFTFLGTIGISLGAVVAALGTAATAIVGFAAAALSVILPLLLIAATIYLVYLAFKNNFMGITTTAKQLWYIIKYYFKEGNQAILEATRIGLASLRENWNAGLNAIGGKIQEWKAWLQNKWIEIRNWLVDAWTNINWGDVGKFIVFGIANGMLGGIPMLVLAATNAAQAALAAIKRTLGIASPSKETFKLGMQTAQGYMLGMKNSMDPNAIAQMMARPVLNQSSSSMQNINISLANGLTIRQAQQMIAQNNDQLLKQINLALGGV